MNGGVTMVIIESVIGFLLSLVVSAIIIYFAAKLLGEKEGFMTAIYAAVIGAVIYAIASYFLGAGWISSLIAGFAWLFALVSLYSIGWLKALVIAIVIWIFAIIIGMLLPTVAGPL